MMSFFSLFITNMYQLFSVGRIETANDYHKINLICQLVNGNLSVMSGLADGVYKCHVIYIIQVPNFFNQGFYLISLLGCLGDDS